MRHFSFVFALLLVACSSGNVDLTVQVSTSLVAGPEFDVVEVALIERVGSSDVIRGTIEHEARFGDPFTRGVQVAAFNDVAPGEWTVRATLKRPDGTTLIKRRLVAQISADTTLTISLTRDCVNVECPGSGSAAYTECLAGHCVDPRCNPSDASTHAFCPDVTFCNAASECDEPAACATNVCVEGVCQSEARVEVDNACDLTHQWCNPENGCEDLPDADGDAGAPLSDDAGAIDADVTTMPDAAQGLDASVDDAAASALDASEDGGVTPAADAEAGDFAVVPADASSDTSASASPDGSGSSVMYTYAGDAGVTSGCDPSELTWRYRDSDHDGYGASYYGTGIDSPTDRYHVCPLDPNYVDNGDEHSWDGNAAINPGVAERCDGVDNDGDSMIDGAAADADCGEDAYCLDGTCFEGSACTPIIGPISGTVTETGVWCSPTNEITIQGAVTIRQDVHVVVARGTTLKMALDGSTKASIVVRGKFELHGSALDPVIVESAEASPAAYDWQSFTTETVSGQPRLYMSYTTVRHASTVFAYSSSTSAYARNSVFESNASVVNTSFDARDSVFHDNRTVFDLSSNSFLVDCEMYDNTSVLKAGSWRATGLNVHDNVVVFDNGASGQATFSRFVGNTIFMGTSYGSSFGPEATGIYSSLKLFYNLIADNGNGLRLNVSLTGQAYVGSVSPPPAWTADDWSYNTLCNNGSVDMYVSTGEDKYVRNNYWCTADAGEIATRIWDLYDTASSPAGYARFEPFLTAPDPLTPVYAP